MLLYFQQNGEIRTELCRAWQNETLLSNHERRVQITWLASPLKLEQFLICSCWSLFSARLLLLCSKCDSLGGLSPAVFLVPTVLVWDRCCCMMRWTDAADSAYRDSDATVLCLKWGGEKNNVIQCGYAYFLIFVGVLSWIVCLFCIQAWVNTSTALSRFLAFFTSSFLIRSLASLEMFLQSLCLKP